MEWDPLFEYCHVGDKKASMDYSRSEARIPVALHYLDYLAFVT